METNKNVFTNGEITVTYQPRQCINAEACAKGLSQVFRTSVIPWIDLEAADSKTVIKQIKKCPSGALSFRYNKKRVAVK